MYCSACGKALPEGAKFCLECGAAAVILTPHPMEPARGDTAAQPELSADERQALLDRAIDQNLHRGWKVATRLDSRAELQGPWRGPRIPRLRRYLEIQAAGSLRSDLYEGNRPLPVRAFAPLPSPRKSANLGVRFGVRQLSFDTVRRPAEIIDAAVHYFGGVTGWTITSRTEESVTFSYQVRPGCGTALLLAILGIIPGVLYWFFARHVATTTLSGSRTGGRTRVHVSWSHDRDCRNFCAYFAQSIRQQEPPP